MLIKILAENTPNSERWRVNSKVREFATFFQLAGGDSGLESLERCPDVWRVEKVHVIGVIEFDDVPAAAFEAFDLGGVVIMTTFPNPDDLFAIGAERLDHC